MIVPPFLAALSACLTLAAPPSTTSTTTTSTTSTTSTTTTSTTSTTSATSTSTSTPTARGVALGLFASDPNWDYGPLLDEIAALGATDVLITVVWAQETVQSARIRRSTQANTLSASDATVVRTLQQARARGLTATLFPIVRLERHTRSEWRGTIAPAAGTDAWFSSYRDYLLTMADLANSGGAARLSVGSELLSLEAHERHWRALIADVRKRFGGRLLYSANWDHYEEVGFWDAVDDVGVTAYFELAASADSAVDADRWRFPRLSLLDFAARTKKPLVITEVGYPSIRTAAWHPWDETARAPLDHALQARLYTLFCDTWKGQALAGFFVWNWFGFGGVDDAGYTPRKKPAAAALAACLRDPAWARASFSPAPPSARVTP